MALAVKQFQTPTFGPVKPTALALSFFILLLTVVPCCAEESCGDEPITEQTTNDAETCDLCPPFVTCGSCPGGATPSASLMITNALAEERNVPFPVSEFIEESSGCKIWQPPRLG